jgi:hypothetical protein
VINHGFKAKTYGLAIGFCFETMINHHSYL